MKEVGAEYPLGRSLKSMTLAPPRVPLLTVPARAALPGFAEAVRDGLTQPRKSLPSRFLYDARGSELFERITALPAYYPTRTELSILRAHGRAMMAGLARGDLVEFGSGSAAKTGPLLDGLGREGRYVPVDISETALAGSVESLRKDRPGLRIHGLVGDWRDALDHLPPSEGPRTFLFLGSSLGNLTHDEAEQFLSDVSRRMEPDDRFLLGLDRTKDPRVIEGAYNDVEGVTEAFNKNLLRRVNRDLGGDVPTWRFRHVARWDAEGERIEMRLEAREDVLCTVRELSLDVAFAAGESVHTEWCHKYSEGRIEGLAAAAGLVPERIFSDPDDWFSVVRLRRAS